jgi:diaminopimelate decarboxylase
MAKRVSKKVFTVYDSPLKTEADIRECLADGSVLNVDNLQELEIVAAVVKEMGGEKALKNSVGIRLNPQVGGGSLAGFSTATLTSKFGIGLRDDDGLPVLNAYLKHSW